MLVVVPVMGALTEYQQGFEEGLKAGMRMGILLGAASYDSSQAQSYDSLVDVFNQGIASVFRDNQTAINMFHLPPYKSGSATTQGQSHSASILKPIEKGEGTNSGQSQTTNDIF